MRPRWGQDEAKMGQDEAKIGQDGAKIGQDEAKMKQNLTQEGQYLTGRLGTDPPGSENHPMVGSGWALAGLMGLSWGPSWPHLGLILAPS